MGKQPEPIKVDEALKAMRENYLLWLPKYVGSLTDVKVKIEQKLPLTDEEEQSIMLLWPIFRDYYWQGLDNKC